ncbi:MAG: VIT1/CCC1 transporter family protein [Nitriliruptorales bacterium]
MSIERPFDTEPASATDYPMDWIAEHIDEERRRISLLGEIREVVFGAQDGLVSTLAVVATVAGATNDQLAILIAGLAAALAGVFSMAIGEYMGSKSQREIFQWHITDEWEEVAERPLESQAEVAYMFMEEGMDEADARHVAEILGRYPESLLATMISKELGLAYDEGDETKGTPLRGALLMGASFAVGGAIPILPFLFGSGLVALGWATGLTAAVLFAVGAVKSRWTHRFWLWSGLEIVLLAAAAGTAGYLFGTVLPGLLGFATPA